MLIVFFPVNHCGRKGKWVTADVVIHFGNVGKLFLQTLIIKSETVD